MPPSLCSILTTCSLLATSNAWGTLGHETVAYVAQNFVSSSTASWAQGILSDTSTSYLANYATWADTYRYTSAGTFSAPFHFIDANDKPPSSCSVDFDRDCGPDGCVVSAIQNYVNMRAQAARHKLANRHRPLASKTAASRRPTPPKHSSS